jgi:hypothetical protein
MPTIQDENEEEDEDGGQTGTEGRPASQPTSPSQEDEHPPTQGATATSLAREAATDHDQVASHSYIVNLQPSPGSAFFDFLSERRAQCARDYGSDPTYLFPPHVPVTGFFEAQHSQADSLVRIMKELLFDLQSHQGADNVQVGKVICTSTGYVLFDVQATAIKKFFLKRLEERSMRELGLCIRSKQVNHISLAANRPDEASRENIRAVYDPPFQEKPVSEACASACFDVVLSQLLSRSSFERLEEDGPHKLTEVARLPVVVSGAAVSSSTDTPS